MSRRLSPRRFQQSLKAGLPVHRRAPGPQTVEASSGVWIFTSDAEGQCVSRAVCPASEFPEPPSEVWTFTAREHGRETGLFHHRVRSYDPSVGRWLSEEPLQFAAEDPNRYRYVAIPPKNQGEKG